MFHILYGFLGASEVNAKGAIMENRSQPVFTILSSLMAWLIRKASRYISIKMATGGYSRRGKTPRWVALLEELRRDRSWWMMAFCA